MKNKEQYHWTADNLNPQRDLIIDVLNQLSIEVIPLDIEFEVNNSEVQYYGDDYGDPLMFQTIGYKNEPISLIEAAIMWYASGPLDNPQMQLTKTPI